MVHRLLLLLCCLVLSACGDELPVAAPVGESPVAALAELDALAEHPRARSVVLFTIDTLRADRIAMYRSDAPSSPATERLGAQSLVFDRAYSQASNTSPAVASFLTGLLPPRHGVMNQTEKLHDHVISLPVMVQQAGLRTGSFVANLCKLQSVKPSVFNEGWDVRFCGMDSNRPQRDWGAAVVDAGLEFIRQAEADGVPYFAWIHLMDPHSEYSPGPADWDDKADPLSNKFDQLQFLSGFEETLEAPPEHVLQRLNALYDAEVSGSSRLLGRFLNAFDEFPRSDESALIFSADHGEELYETWHRIGHGLSMTEGVLHVPLAVRAPGLQPGRSDALTETLAITPTVLALLGLEAPYALDGQSVLSGHGVPAARSFESGFSMTLRTDDHRYWRRLVTTAPTREVAAWRLLAPWFQQPECLATFESLWDHQPQWLDMRAPQQQSLADELRAQGQQVVDMVIAQLPQEEVDDPDFLEQLRQLGYIGEAQR
ncbi:MAG: hypothetical protein ACI9EF_001189 [Pseudohongiellaceae bacterium]|jgi:hypothetical protein